MTDHSDMNQSVSGDILSSKRNVDEITKVKQLFSAVRSFKKDNGELLLCQNFLRCPNTRDQPKYRDIIKKSISIGNIHMRLNKDEYENADSLQDDFELLVNNAKHFYEDTNEIMNLFTKTKEAIFGEIDISSPPLKKQKLYLPSAPIELRDEEEVVFDVFGAVQELLISLFASIRDFTKEGRCLYNNLMALPLYDEIEGEKNAGISLGNIGRRLHGGDYKRLDVLQNDIFKCLDRARRISKSDSEIFNNSVELQAFFIRQRDEICKQGKVLLSPALMYNQFDLDDAVSMIQPVKRSDELESVDVEDDESDIVAPTPENIVNESVPNVKDARYHSCRDRTYFEQYNTTKCLIKLGDSVFIKSEANNQMFIRRIHKIWKTTNGEIFIHGPRLKLLADMSQSPNDKMINRQEVVLCTSKEVNEVSQIVGKCAVLNRSEFISCRPTEIIEDRVYFCEWVYDEDDEQFYELSLTKHGLKKFIHHSSVLQDEVYFFSRVSNECDKVLNKTREQHDAIFTWEELNNIKRNLSSDTKGNKKHIRNLIYNCFIRTKEPEKRIKEIANDLTRFAETYYLRIPKNPVLDIMYLLLRSKHVPKMDSEWCTIEESELILGERSNDFNYQVPAYIPTFSPGKSCGGQCVIFTTAAKHSVIAAEKIWCDPPPEPRDSDIVNTSDSDTSVPFKSNQKLSYQLFHLGSSWTALFMGNNPFLTSHASRDNRDVNISAVSNKYGIRVPPLDKVSENTKESSAGSSKSGKKNLSNEGSAKIDLKACELAQITTIPAATARKIITDGDKLIVDVLIVCQNLQLCRYLSATFGLVHLDELLLDLINQKVDKTGPRYKFKDSDIDGSIDIWWTELLNVKGDHKLFRTIQTRYAEYLFVGCHNVAVTSFPAVISNVTANSFAAIKDPELELVNPELYTCITEFSPEHLFLSGISALTSIINCLLKYTASIPMKVLWRSKYYEINVSLISVIPFYVLRGISAAKFSKEMADKTGEIIRRKDKLY